jgi:hypothetical protein
VVVEGHPPDADDPLIPPPADEAGSRGSSSITEGVKKALLAGVGALFMTEEGARRLAREWKLPKEVASFIGQQAQSAKDEVLRALGDEIRRFLQSESIRREFLKALTENSIEIRAEIRFRPSSDDAGGGPRPEVNAEVKPRRARKDRK